MITTQTSHYNPLDVILSLSFSNQASGRERGRKEEIPLFFNHLWYAML